MGHILFASTPAWGHLLPVLPGLAELVRRGHRVSCLASASFVRDVAKVADPVPYSSPMDGSAALSDMATILPLMLAEARASYAALDRVARADPPDVIVSDVLANSGWMLGQVTGIPLVRTWPVFASNEEFSLHLDYESRPDDTASMAAFFVEAARFLDEVGLDVPPQQFFDNVAERNIALYPREVQPRGETFDSRFTFVTPCIRPAENSPESAWLSAARPLAVISLGTVFTENIGFFRACLDAVEGLGWHAAAAIGDRIRQADIGRVGEHVLLRAKLPMIDALKHASILVSHGGLTSTLEALAHGVPVLIAPQIGEQRAVADRIESLGLGARLTEPFSAEDVASRIKAVVNDQALARRISDFQAKLRAERSGAEFADAVERAFSPVAARER